MEHLKEKGSLQIYEAWSNIRYKCRNRGFCRKGHYVDTTGKNAPARPFVRRSGVASSMRAMPVTEDPRVLRGDLSFNETTLFVHQVV